METYFEGRVACVYIDSHEAFPRGRNKVRVQGRRLKFWGVIIWGCFVTFWMCLMKPRDGS